MAIRQHKAAQAWAQEWKLLPDFRYDMKAGRLGSLAFKQLQGGFKNEIEAPRKSNDVTMKTLIPRSSYNFSLTKAVIVVLA